MGVYVDVEDIQEHFIASAALEDEAIEEVMAEQEGYVRMRLGLSALPPDHGILRNIIRNLTIAQSIFNLLPMGSADYEKANIMQSEALRRLTELQQERTGLPSKYTEPQGWEAEVINPFTKKFFTPEDFGLDYESY